MSGVEDREMRRLWRENQDAAAEEHNRRVLTGILKFAPAGPVPCPFCGVVRANQECMVAHCGIAHKDAA